MFGGKMGDKADNLVASPADIVIYESIDGKTKLETRVANKSIWLSQLQICELYGKAKSTISEHIKAIFEDGELDKDSVVRKFRTTATDGKNYDVEHYNLEMIIAIGFKVRSTIGTKFRIWANDKLQEYIEKGFVLDDDRFKSGKQMHYFDELQKGLERLGFLSGFSIKR